MKKLILVTLKLENSEYIYIKSEHIISYKVPSVLLENSDGIKRAIDFYIKIDGSAREKDYLYSPMMGYSDEKEDNFERLLREKDICEVCLAYEDYTTEFFVPCGRRINDLVLGNDSYRLDSDGNLEIHVTYTLSSMERYFKKSIYIDFNSKINDPFAYEYDSESDDFDLIVEP